MDIIRRLWCGLYPLPKAFWGFYVIGFFATWLIVGIPAALLAALIHSLRPLFLIAGVALHWTYWVVASVGVWRSANNTKNYIAFWRYAARGVVLLFVLMYISGFASGGGQALIERIMGDW